ncbi:peptidoglycan bridge formation glycyltransferase FemA/FemB family protein [Patescibacteria group bacterium]|nr:peptidoglycan bridge formation glycyltransferase FemA/FemB family protein [Patescibacteria group bacterium]MCL5010025.1 peptidoglycan bridge formation glycyltransferase FemA/FemB family protein [Patescibacteria group bacterium]
MNNGNNEYAGHPLQSLEWGKFRQKTKVKVIRQNGWQITIHKIPHTPWAIGYFPKGPPPDKEMLKHLIRIGKDNHCIFIQLEPNAQKISNFKFQISNLGLRPSFHPLFTKYTFILDLTKSEEELLKNMHPKTRYNIKIAQKHAVTIVEDNSDKAFEEYLKLTKETTKRQGFFAHDEKYHRLMWETLKSQKPDENKLTAHLLLAKFRPPKSGIRDLTLAAWILFVYGGTLYYPYGASSDQYRNVMASSLMMWEAIRFGKKLGLKKFDMWGSLGPNPNKEDPWYGFHRFKQGYKAELVEFVGSFDLVINPLLYVILRITDRLRWFLLRFIR